MIREAVQRGPRWLIVGGDGLIGRALGAAAAAVGHAILKTTRRAGSRPADPPVITLNLEADPQTWRLPPRIDAAFLCAAITKLADCEADPAHARSINVTATVALARRLAERGAHVVFLSTNQVFDGTRPHMPADAAPRPVSCYGRLKVEAEQHLLALGPAVTVVRLTKVFESTLPLLRGWAEKLLAGRPIEPFADMSLAPVPLAEVVRVLLAVGERRPAGIIQLSGPQDMTCERLARHLVTRLGVDDALVRPIRAAQSGRHALHIAQHTTLDTTLAEHAFGFRCPSADELLDAAWPALVSTEREHV